MKKLFFATAFLTTLLSFGQTIYVPGGFTSTGIGTSTVGGSVGIGTNAPTEKLEVNGNIKAKIGIFTNSLPNGSTFTSAGDRSDKCLVFSAGALLGTGPGYLKTRMFHFYDFPISNLNSKSELYFSIEDRADQKRYKFSAETAGNTNMAIYNKSQQLIFNFFEDGNDNLSLTLPKTNSYLGIGTSTPTEKLDVVGNSKISGKASIGGNSFPTNSLYTNYNLFVKGGILTDEVRVALSSGGTWADYVFAKDYNLKPLSEVEAFIAKNKHLPNVPSAAQVKEEGINIGDMARIQQEKIEELTLYIIEQNKRIEALEAKMNTK